MLNVKDLMTNEGSETFYNQSFRNLIEDHLFLLKQTTDFEKVSVTAHHKYKYGYDLYGLLCELNYPREYHWIILRLNGMHNYCDFNDTHNILIVPTISKVQNLMKVFKAKESII